MYLYEQETKSYVWYGFLGRVGGLIRSISKAPGPLYYFPVSWLTVQYWQLN